MKLLNSLDYAKKSGVYEGLFMTLIICDIPGIEITDHTAFHTWCLDTVKHVNAKILEESESELR